MRKVVRISVVLVLLLAGVAILLKIANSRSFQFFGEIIPRVETSENVVALTFDDGPTPEFTDAMLQILREEDVKATFFLIGGELEKHLDEGKKIVTAGHEVGNHTFSHIRMWFVTPSFVRDEIEKTDEFIRATGYEKPTHFRPPYGKKLFTLPYYLSQHNRKSITWDVEPETYPDIAKSTDKIVEHVLTNTKPGSIILLHPMYDRERRSLNAVIPIIKGLKEKGYRFVTVSELIENKK